jgi:excisionase family DNA binding protein
MDSKRRATTLGSKLGDRDKADIAEWVRGERSSLLDDLKLDPTTLEVAQFLSRGWKRKQIAETQNRSLYLVRQDEEKIRNAIEERSEGQSVGDGHDLMASADTRHFLDAEQAAEFLGGLNSRTVTRWAREGYLPAYPIGEGKRRLWRFLESDLEQWMLSRRTGQISVDLQACADTLWAAADASSKGVSL